jgi:hypothetical protein
MRMNLFQVVYDVISESGIYLGEFRLMRRLWKGVWGVQIFFNSTILL